MNADRNLAWTGWWIAIVGIIHTVFGLLVYSTGWLAIRDGGFWNAVDGEIHREHAFWFTFFGPAAMLLGALMVWVEQHSDLRLPRFLGWSFLGTVAVTGFLMPVSGIWLLIPPGIALVWRRPVALPKH